jgi:hypothetical protein
VTGREHGQDADMQIGLRLQDADAILAIAEWALNRPDLDMGPGLYRHNAEEACRRIESVAAIERRGLGEARWEAQDSGATNESFTLREALRTIKAKCDLQGQTVLVAEIGRIADDALREAPGA